MKKVFILIALAIAFPNFAGAAAADNLTPLNFSSGKAVPTASVDAVGGENLQNAILELDNAQIEIRNELLNYKTKYSDVDAQYQAVRDKRRELKKQVRDTEKRIRDLDRQKEGIRKNMV
jgi:septal ring factor EnvC (AmiA/AmiB activator)